MSDSDNNKSSPQGIPPIPPPPQYVFITYDSATPTPVTDNESEIDTPSKKWGMAIASMVLGIVALVLCCLPILSAPCGLVGLVLSLVSLIKKRDGRRMAIAGLACSYIALFVVFIVLIVALLMKIPFIQDNFENLLWNITFNKK